MATHIISVGGSILSPSDDILFDFNKARDLKLLLSKYIDNGHRFVLVVGGGKICRRYQALMKEQNMPDIELDNIGVAVINTNAVMLRAVMGDLASTKVLRYGDFDSDEPLQFDAPVIVTAASNPGHSSDWNAVKLGVRTGSTSVINLSNTKGVYDSDPKKNPNAKFLPNITWDEYFEIVGNPADFPPGAHFPFDIMAARMAKDSGISCSMIDGRVGNSLDDLLSKNICDGTIIKN